MSDRKAELKRAYKESHRPMGVFQIRNNANGKIFIGSSSNVPGLLNRHRFELEMGGHRNREMQDDWNTDGADSFVFEMLEELEPPEAPGWNPKPDLEALEELWLEKLEPFGVRGYNRAPRARSEDRIDVEDAEKALREAEQEGTISLAELKDELGL